MRPIRVLIVDDHELVRVGLRTVLEARPRFSVVGEARTVAEAVALAAERAPDVVVMDIRLPDGTGIEACREIRDARPDTRVIMLTAYADEDLLIGSIVAGASGYVLKHYGSDSLCAGIEAVAEGGSLLDPTATARVLDKIRRVAAGEGAEPRKLTPYESRVLALIAEGRTNREIAAALHTTVRAVKHHVSSVLAKLNVPNRSAAAALAGRHSRADSAGHLGPPA